MAQIEIFIGTQGEGEDDGIWHSTLDLDIGRLSTPTHAARIERPTWLVRHPHLPMLYAVSEVGNRDARDGRLHALRLADGHLEAVNDVSAQGGGPTDLYLDPVGKTLFVANFGGGQVSAVPLAADGSLSPSMSQLVHFGSGPHKRQTKPHPHGVTLDPSGLFLLAPDMGADRLFIHAFDPLAGVLQQEEARAIELPAGAGPRLVRFGPDGRFAYLLTELSAQLFVYRAFGPGEFELVQSVSLDPLGHEGEPSAAALEMSGDGRHLYASNRRTHEIHAFAIDEVDGTLEQVQSISSGGERPWSATLSPHGTFLLVANQASDSISVFARDTATGRLAAVAGTSIRVPAPTCVLCV